MTVNYTAAVSEMMLPLLPLLRELARNRFCLVELGSEREREGEDERPRKPEIKKSFSTIDHGRRHGVVPGGGGGAGQASGDQGGGMAAREVSGQ